MTSQPLASLLDQSIPANRSTAASSAAQASQFETLLKDSSAEPPPVELTALQKLFRSPIQTGPPAPAVTARTLELSTPSLPALEFPFEEDDSAGPAPAAPWPVMKMQTPTQPELGPIAKQAIRGALQQAGIDPAGVRMAYWEELVGYPGGSYINRNITVEASNGRKIDLDAAYMTRCPWLAAEVVRDLDQSV